MADHSLVRGLVRDWETVADHVADPDPHPQYALEVESLSAFSFAAYGGMTYAGGGFDFPNIGASWQYLDMFNTLSVATPRHITVDLSNDTISTDAAGIYQLSAAMSFNHNSSNDGRITRARLFDGNTGQPLGFGFQVGTGRNAESTSLSVSLLIEITPSMIDHELAIQIGGGDNYSAVEFTSAAYSIHSVGEFRGDLETQ